MVLCAGSQFGYCRKMFLSHSVLMMLADMRQQVIHCVYTHLSLLCVMVKCAQVMSELLHRGYIAGGDVAFANRNSSHPHIILAAVAAGLYPHIAQREIGRTSITSFLYVYLCT